MSGPPENIAPSALFQLMCAMPRPGRDVEIPRKDPVTGDSIGMLHCRVLTMQERLAAMTEAERTVKKLLRDNFAGSAESGQGQSDIYNNELSLQLVQRAMRRVEDPELPFFPTAGDARKNLTGDEVGVLMSRYLIIQAELGPIVAVMEAGEVDAWVKRLVEGASRDPLGLLSLDALMDLVMHLVSRQYSSVTGTGSSTSPAESTSPADDDPMPAVPETDVEEPPVDDTNPAAD